MKYPMSNKDWVKFNEFMQYASANGEHSLHHAVKAFIFDGEQTIKERRNSALMVASIMSSVASYAFNALEEVGWELGEGRENQIFTAESLVELDYALGELTSGPMYTHMANHSAMRKLFNALTEFMNDAKE